MVERCNNGQEHSVYCRCGAQWHGRYVHSDRVPIHAQRCGPAISSDEFQALGYDKKRLPHWQHMDRLARRALSGASPQPE